MAEKKTYTSNLHKMLPAVVGCCYEDLQVKVRNWSDFDYLESSGDTLGARADMVATTPCTTTWIITPTWLI